MTKQELIGRIATINRSARAEFLAEFSEAELQQYLNNLEAVWGDFKAQFVTNEAEPSESVELEAALVAG
ncbi:MAG: hypothetical protein GXY33_13970 [Phycisphaerae bacterium]|nr:hypothetical protein [Phycisphaerae bacterium]